MYVVKTYLNGSIDWEDYYGQISFDRGESVIETADGGYLIVGSTNNYGAIGSNIWIVKLNSSGSLKWHRNYGGYDSEIAHSVIKTSDNNFILVGDIKDYAVPYEPGIIIMKFNSTGDQLWNKTYLKSVQCSALSIIETKDGEFVIAGWTQTPSIVYEDMWLIKTDSAGNERWNRTFGGPAMDFGYSVVETAEKGYIVVGSKELGAPNANEMWLVKTYHNGTLEWEQLYGGTAQDYGKDIVKTSDKRFLVAGHTNSYSPPNMEYDLWVLKLNISIILPQDPVDNSSSNSSTDDSTTTSNGSPGFTVISFMTVFVAVVIIAKKRKKYN